MREVVSAPAAAKEVKEACIGSIKMPQQHEDEVYTYQYDYWEFWPHFTEEVPSAWPVQ